MNRTHVRLMHEQSGYSAARRVLLQRKARGEFAVYLELLEKERLHKLRQHAAQQEDADADLCTTTQTALRRGAGARGPAVHQPHCPRQEKIFPQREKCLEEIRGLHSATQIIAG